MTVLVVLALAAAGYYGWHVVPLYMDNVDVREAADQAFNVYVLDGEKAASEMLMLRLNGKIGWHYEVDDEGVEQVKPGLGLTEDNYLIEFDEKTRKLTVRIEYQRTIEFAGLKKRKTYPFLAQKSAVLQK